MNDDWRDANRANWDERVGVHLASRAYDLGPLRAGAGRLNPIEEAELGPVKGLRVLHLQCHFGRDSLVLAQRGAEVVGLDFSKPAIAAACALAAELGLESRTRFVQADLYDATAAIDERASFDRVFVTWGAINWLPDIEAWSEIVAHFLKPDGQLYLAESHPAALVFDDAAQAGIDGMPGDRMPGDRMPGRFAPYFQQEPIIVDDPNDYADPQARLANSVQYTWMHPLSRIVTSLINSGLRLDWLHEHPALPWAMFKVLVEDGSGLYRWPDKPWLPLAFSLKASKPVSSRVDSA